MMTYHALYTCSVGIPAKLINEGLLVLTQILITMAPYHKNNNIIPVLAEANTNLMGQTTFSCILVHTLGYPLLH